MTNVRRSFWRLAAIASLAASVSCSSPSPTLYAIARMDGAVQAGGPKVVLLQQVALARYLERAQIVRSSENLRLDIAQNDWWGEPLASMLGRVLIDELSQRLPHSTVLGENGGIGYPADATIELSIRRLDEDATGKLVLQAQSAVSFKGQPRPVLQSFRFVVAAQAPDVQAEVAAISTAVGLLADGLAATLAASPTRR